VHILCVTSFSSSLLLRYYSYGDCSDVFASEERTRSERSLKSSARAPSPPMHANHRVTSGRSGGWEWVWDRIRKGNHARREIPDARPEISRGPRLIPRSRYRCRTR